jgi:hypothetical protein
MGRGSGFGKAKPKGSSRWSVVSSRWENQWRQTNPILVGIGTGKGRFRREAGGTNEPNFRAQVSKGGLSIPAETPCGVTTNGAGRAKRSQFADTGEGDREAAPSSWSIAAGGYPGYNGTGQVGTQCLPPAMGNVRDERFGWVEDF